MASRYSLEVQLAMERHERKRLLIMERKAVESSNIKAIGYNAESKTLEVDFGGSVYHYHDVPEEEHAELMKAKSVGSHLHQRIKKVYKFTKLA